MSKKTLLRETVDETTGEVLERKAITTSLSKLPEHEPFIKLFVRDVAALNGLPPSHFKVLHALACLVDYQGNVFLNPIRREKIAVEHGINARTVQNIVSSLCATDLLVRITQNQYTLSPYYFAKGEWASVLEQRNAFSIKLRYSKEQGRTVEFVSEPNAGEKS